MTKKCLDCKSNVIDDLESEMENEVPLWYKKAGNYSLLPKLLKKKNLTTKIFNKSENPLLVKKYKIETYPALVRVRGKRHKLFKDKRNMKNILKFLR